jgi:hypothetical protein
MHCVCIVAESLFFLQDAGKRNCLSNTGYLGKIAFLPKLCVTGCLGAKLKKRAQYRGFITN